MNLLPPPSTLPPSSTVWAYLRDSGGEHQDRSIPRQLEAIQAYCKQHRLQLIHIYQDEAKSGTTTAGRDDFHRMIAQSDTHINNPTGLLLWSFSRFGRNLDDATYYKSRLRRNDIIIHSLTDQIPEGPYSRFVETLVDISNEERSRQTSIDAKDGLRSIVQQGAVPGTPPHGFKRVPIETINSRTGEKRINHRWVPDPKLRARVRQAFQMRAAGSSLLQINKATRLYGSINSYRTFFTNKLYIGILEFGGLTLENYCKPIVDRKTWDAVQKIIAANSQRQFGIRHPKRVNSAYLFSGILKCARCGAPMNGNTVTRDNLPNRDEAYRCSRSMRRAGCDAGRISRRKLEDLVLATLNDFILQPDNLSATQAIALENQTVTEAQRTARKKELQKDKADHARAIANLTQAIGASGHSEALLKTLDDKESALAQIKADLVELDIPLELIPALTPLEIERQSKQLLRLVNASKPEDQRQNLRAILHEIRAERVDKNIFALVSYYFPPPFDSAPTGTLPILLLPVGAHRYRQLFTYPISTHR
jgi:site-specific DNA recombinase